MSLNDHQTRSGVGTVSVGILALWYTTEFATDGKQGTWPPTASRAPPGTGSPGWPWGTAGALRRDRAQLYRYSAIDRASFQRAVERAVPATSSRSPPPVPIAWRS